MFSHGRLQSVHYTKYPVKNTVGHLLKQHPAQGLIFWNNSHNWESFSSGLLSAFLDLWLAIGSLYQMWAKSSRWSNKSQLNVDLFYYLYFIMLMLSRGELHDWNMGKGTHWFGQRGRFCCCRREIISPEAGMKRAVLYLITVYGSVPVILYLFPWILGHVIFSHLCK